MANKSITILKDTLFSLQKQSSRGVQKKGVAPTTLFKKRLWHRCFPVNFVKFLRTPFFIDHPLVDTSEFSLIQL